MESDFLTQFAELLELDTPAKKEDIFREYDIWDSLAYLSVISWVDETYDLVIPKDVFGEMRTVEDIINYINQNR